MYCGVSTSSTVSPRCVVAACAYIKGPYLAAVQVQPLPRGARAHWSLPAAPGPEHKASAADQPASRHFVVVPRQNGFSHTLNTHLWPVPPQVESIDPCNALGPSRRGQICIRYVLSIAAMPSFDIGCNLKRAPVVGHALASPTYRATMTHRYRRGPSM